jgi:hypothetical protein
MFVGHLGAGLGARRAAPGVSLGVLFLAALLLDAALWVFVLLGLETVHFPPGSTGPRYPTFTFPYSHGLIASFVWATAAGLLAGCSRAGLRACLVVGATVFSHFVLDALVHVGGLPLLGSGSYHVGLGLWRHTGLELAVECALGGLGWLLYVGAPGAARGGTRWALGLTILLCAFLTIAGGLAAGPASPAAAVVASTSLLMIGVVSGLGFWLDRAGRAR